MNPVDEPLQVASLGKNNDSWTIYVELAQLEQLEQMNKSKVWLFKVRFWSSFSKLSNASSASLVSCFRSFSVALSRIQPKGPGRGVKITAALTKYSPSFAACTVGSPDPDSSCKPPRRSSLVSWQADSSTLISASSKPWVQIHLAIAGFFTFSDNDEITLSPFSEHNFDSFNLSFKLRNAEALAWSVWCASSCFSCSHFSEIFLATYLAMSFPSSSSLGISCCMAMSIWRLDSNAPRAVCKCETMRLAAPTSQHAKRQEVTINLESNIAAQKCCMELQTTYEGLLGLLHIEHADDNGSSCSCEDELINILDLEHATNSTLKKAHHPSSLAFGDRKVRVASCKTTGEHLFISLRQDSTNIRISDCIIWG